MRAHLPFVYSTRLCKGFPYPFNRQVKEYNLYCSSGAKHCLLMALPGPFSTLFERPPSHHRFFYLSIVLHLIESASLKKSIFKLSDRIQDGV